MVGAGLVEGALVFGRLDINVSRPPKIPVTSVGMTIVFVESPDAKTP